ncbi:MAG: hypothetical protein WAL80_24775 [Xanthobacteraceae bacterium]
MGGIIPESMGGLLRNQQITLQDAADYMLRMSEIRQNMSGWQYVAKLMLDTASGEDIGCQVSLALMLDGQMVFE